MKICYRREWIVIYLEANNLHIHDMREWKAVLGEGRVDTGKVKGCNWESKKEHLEEGRAGWQYRCNNQHICDGIQSTNRVGFCIFDILKVGWG